MATWKKIVVSGSSVSQLNNDAGYVTAGTLGLRNYFSTASYDGTNLLSNSQTGSLNFASSSGQGLTISADAGTDTLTFGLSAIPNNSLLNSSITIAGNNTALGGTVTQAQILASSGVWSGSAQLPAGVVSGSSQVSYTGLSNVPAGIVSGSAQVLAGLAGSTIHSGSYFAGVTVVSGSSQITYSGISGIPAGIVSASVLTSPGQGQALLTTNGVGGGTVDLGLETTDSPTFNSLQLNGNLTVVGTASFQNTQNLLVGDRFVLFASGSTTTGDGGFLVQQGTQNVGELFGWNSTGLGRWAVTSSFNAASGSFTADAFMAAVVISASLDPNAAAPALRYNVKGNIFVPTAGEDIWIYS